ncbi:MULTISPECIES: FAD-binding oxidoreductase [unclassified Mesorhizobium]|uniref:NAD(P)/FAD-dependent oxidoreductase n=1 Tax=unclassified Mesorhizobium TaxID=325217 RepID=UPI000BAEA0C4|nr:MULTISPECIES: FAD-binding oxidoreductase [unclassified Mesorhizobium]TGT57240.1 FAD-binding oxidoreductase [Mesorhizobium sp. M00.F.Ca.ET.170.01.1.1]AZO12007.1 FAD-binding oxidoreductase [Mesorhizobium sp. M3A.F.Ca.ET.080.04.2.1]PBB86096.1 D-amino-acid oxidase [Mesorhizobium sp. WSM3876]RWB66705.1 MAG: FAD-binding oxidoreductase [Mesorhizobium sp.]RWB90656.1 MAG: FAD-binding oxidoreductase [Mesorhizobium sp.]
MNSSVQSHRVAVVGAGIFGVSTALHLARAGAQVTLITESTVASGASGRSLSWLNSARIRSAAYHALRMAGLDRYRTLAQQQPDANWLRFDGGLTWDADDERNEIAAVFKHEKAIGYDARLLRPEEIAAVTPGIDTSAVTPQGAIFNPAEGWVDLPSLIGLLLGEFKARGGTLLENAGQASVNVANGRARGVRSALGDPIEADSVLVATGAAVPALVAESGVRIPDATPISLLVRTKPLNSPLKAVLNTPRVAVRPTLDGALVLDSAWSEEEVEINPDGTYGVREETVKGLLHAASHVLEGNPELGLDGYGVGPKPIPADGEPVLGQLDSIPGYHVAFSHSGATLGLIVGELLGQEILTGEPHPMLATFQPARFVS